jgi:hypothetical protein
MNTMFMLCCTLVATVVCFNYNIGFVQYVIALIITNLIWMLICHYKNWFEDI